MTTARHVKKLGLTFFRAETHLGQKGMTARIAIAQHVRQQQSHEHV